MVLENDNFTVEKRFRKVQDDGGRVVRRILEQIVIIDNTEKKLAKWFTSNFMIQNDAIFSTNAEKLLLFVAVGVTNTIRSFPAAFSFATSESEENFNYFLLVLKQETSNDHPLPRVNLADQGKGLIASISLMTPTVQLQFCAWHAVGNINSRVAQGCRGYPMKRRKEIDSTQSGGIEAYVRTCVGLV